MKIFLSKFYRIPTKYKAILFKPVFNLMGAGDSVQNCTPIYKG